MESFVLAGDSTYTAISKSALRRKKTARRFGNLRAGAFDLAVKKPV
jgi:hypothetical protein